MKRISLIISLSLLALISNAQQIGMYSHYFYKPMVYNPAFTGTSNATNIMLISRSQWTDFKGAPQLNIITADGNLMNKKVGLGVQLISDRKGITNRVGGDLCYSYRLNINDDMHLLFGLSLGIIDQTIDYSKALVENSSDPTLFTNAQNKTTFDGNAGLAIVWKGLEFGAAVPQLLGNKVNYVDNTDVRAYYTQARHYMGSLKYKFYLSKEKGISIAPEGLVRFVPNVPIQYDGNLNFDWQDKFWIGATYKSDYAVGANVGICLHKQIYVGYSYDFIIGDIGKYSGMSSELMLNFKFGKAKKEEEPKPAIVEQPKVDNKTLENAAYVKRMDSLQQQLRESQYKLKELADKLDQQAKLQQNVENKNTEAVEGNKNKVMEEGVWMITNPTSDFKDSNNHLPEKGYYVVVGTFFYRDLAIAETKRFVDKGFKSANWVYYDAKKYNYVYIERLPIKEAAIQKVKEMATMGIKDAWIQILVE